MGPFLSADAGQHAVQHAAQHAKAGQASKNAGQHAGQHFNKRTEYDLSPFGNSREHIAAADAASNFTHCFYVGFECVYLLQTGIKVFLNFWWGLTLTLTFRDHPRSKIFPPFESLYTTSYLTAIDTFSLSRTVLRYSTSKFSGFDLYLYRSPEVKNIFTIRKPIHDLLYLTFIDTFSLSRTVFEIFDLKFGFESVCRL